MSSYHFWDGNQGPPADGNGNTTPPIFNSDNSCDGGYVCEHRWRQIYAMVGFKNAVHGTGVDHWWDNGNNQIAFSRGNRGFVVFNGETYALNQNLATGLSAGTYCDVITGQRYGNSCSGISIQVGADGRAQFYLAADAYDGVIAIHIDAKL